jgi:hypothetical protein
MHRTASVAPSVTTGRRSARAAHDHRRDRGPASWSDQRRSGELLDAYIGAPSRLSQDTSIHPGWNTSIDSLSKLEWGQLISIEREMARYKCMKHSVKPLQMQNG